MPTKLPHTAKENLSKCRSAAIAAVEVYNRPGPRFRTAHYLVMITIAWTALFHAIFYAKRRRPWYSKKGSGSGRGVRYEKIDGEPKHWDLGECVRQHFGSAASPERQNLEFIIGLRNRIEHRYLPDLDASLYGECQAALMNLEELLVSEFGKRYALLDELALALQFSQIIPAERKQAARRLAGSASTSVRDYVEKFRGGLPSSTLNSMKYSFNVYLVPRVVNRQSAADAAVSFVRVDEASSEELSRLEKLNVLIKEKHIPIANLNMYKPSQVVEAVSERLPRRFTMGTHTAAWKHYKVRPATGAEHPERTDQVYCFYDEVHEDYVYTQAWVDRLVRDLGTDDGYRTVAVRKAEALGGGGESN